VLRLETEFPLPVPDEYGIAGGAFVDYGSVWEVGNTDPIGTTDDPDGTGVLYDDFTPRATAGLSLFWNTPLGPLRFNFTRPIIAEDRDETQNFDVTVSTRF
jgi:outer membrane protein insertion porin family